MNAALWLSAACLISLTGMAWLASSQAEHWRRLHPASALPSRAHVLRLRVLGLGSLVLAGWCCLQVDQGGMALLVWLMLQITASTTTACVLAWRPSVLRLLHLNRQEIP